MNRRTFLSVLAGTAAGTTGCLGRSSPADSEITSSGSRSTTGPTTDSPTDSTTVVRCRGEPVPIERTVTDASGYGDTFEYFSANDTVRYVEARNDTGPTAFDTVPFEDWGAVLAARSGRQRVREAIETRIGTDEVEIGVGQPPEQSSYGSPLIRLEAATVRGEDGNATQTPIVPFSRLVDAAPGSVDATVLIEGDEYAWTVPLFAKHSKMKTGKRRTNLSE